MKATKCNTDMKSKKEEKLTLAQKCRFYITFSAASIGRSVETTNNENMNLTMICCIVAGILTFSLFLFLIPFVVDPAVATLNHNFVETPVECVVRLNKYILGKA